MRDLSKSGNLPGLKKKTNKEDKERAREEKELKRMQEAAQSKLGGGVKPLVADLSADVDRPDPRADQVTHERIEDSTANSHPGGWGTVTTEANAGGAEVKDEGVALSGPVATPVPKLSFGFGMVKKGTPTKFSMGFKKK